MAIFSAPKHYTEALLHTSLATFGIAIQVFFSLIWFVAAKNLTHGVLGLFSDHPRHGPTLDRLITGGVLVVIATLIHVFLHDKAVLDEAAVIIGVCLGLGLDRRLKRVY
ncbi:hypothetical protein AC579_10124 [Pseudocercospora musae]|uniref:Uncharacterized protein n=1 Tax=Pseudocercospora musae TaxID=113226 RepID=A0A139IS29_9PEZI|nr:hypothetical protein AC579_10124 [Pseudocercospora musae]